MDNEKYENKYNGTARTLRIIGWPILIIGILCMGAGMASFFVGMTNQEMPQLFFLCFIGAPVMMGGIVCLSLGYRKKMGEFMATQTAPVAKDFTNYMLDNTSDSLANTFGKISAAVNKNKPNSQVEGVTANTCAKCGHVNPADSKFCAKCGAPLVKKCPHCGADNDDGAKFCNNCGKELF